MNQILHGDCLFMLKRFVPDASVDLIVTSPPYGEQRSHNYGGIAIEDYERWFLERSKDFMRVLKPGGSFVLNVCPHTEGDGQFKGQEAYYVEDLVQALRHVQGWKLLETYIWRKLNAVPGSVIRRLRNGWEPCFHFVKQLDCAFYPKQVLRPAAPASIERAKHKSKNDHLQQQSATGSGFSRKMENTCRFYRPTNSGMNFDETADSTLFGNEDGLVFPDNVIESATECHNLFALYGDPKDECMASAPFPEKLPAFFIDLLTVPGNMVLDPFAGAGTTGKVAQDKNVDRG
jgi:site-specific DNA-methyltransferase (adenine-specific)/site-specific DNA-methyltransferase (cytosine-N4-specific)